MKCSKITIAALRNTNNARTAPTRTTCMYRKLSRVDTNRKRSQAENDGRTRCAKRGWPGNVRPPRTRVELHVTLHLATRPVRVRKRKTDAHVVRK